MIASADSRFVSRETRDRLNAYRDLVLKWQKSINLIAPSTIAEIDSRHLADSLRLYELAPAPRIWADLGSGGGFPGIVTAICLAERGEGWVHLVESNNKKAAFLRQAIAATGARASVHPVRIEAAAGRFTDPDAVSARALSELPALLELTEPWLSSRPDLQCWFHKGFGYRDEVVRARGQWDFDLVEHPSKVAEGSVILEIRNIQRKSGSGRTG